MLVYSLALLLSTVGSSIGFGLRLQCFNLSPFASQSQRFGKLLDDVIGLQHDRDWIKQQNPDAKFCSGLVKPQREREDPQIFQPVGRRDMLVFSAYYENRPEAGGPAIRIVGSGLQERFNEVGDIHCQLWYDGYRVPISIQAKYIVIYPSLAHGDMWTSHFTLCPLPVGVEALPYVVSITPTPCAEPHNELPVYAPLLARNQDTIALCLQPVYNRFNNWTMVVEMFEIYKLLGVSEINIYEHSIGDMTSLALKSYVTRPRLREKGYKVVQTNVIKWPYPDRLKANIWNQRATLNDCLYRMKPKHRYVIACDLDELLTPRSTDTILELLQKVRRHSDGIFMFQHAYFKRDYHAELYGEKPYLITQTSLERTDKVTPPGKIRCKSMYDSDKAVSLDLHFAYELVKGASEHMMEPHNGMLHHYRSYPMESFAKNPHNYHYIKDVYMHKYKANLTAAYEARVNAVIKLMK